MNDFNLRPEIMGFGRPNRLLETPPTHVQPADDWKTYKPGIEANALGQLRTNLPLPPKASSTLKTLPPVVDPAPKVILNSDWVTVSVPYPSDGCSCDNCAGVSSDFGLPLSALMGSPTTVTRDANGTLSFNTTGGGGASFSAAGKTGDPTDGPVFGVVKRANTWDDFSSNEKRAVAFNRAKEQAIGMANVMHNPTGRAAAPVATADGPVFAAVGSIARRLAAAAEPALKNRFECMTDAELITAPVYSSWCAWAQREELVKRGLVRRAKT